MAWKALDSAERADGGQLLMRDPKETALAGNSCFISLWSVPAAQRRVGEFARDHLSWLFNWAVQPVTNVRGEEAFEGKELIRKRPSGETAY